MLGNSEYGLITQNSEQELYAGLKRILEDRNLLDHYRKQAIMRGKQFTTKSTVTATENMLDSL